MAVIVDATSDYCQPVLASGTGFAFNDILIGPLAFSPSPSLSFFFNRLLLFLLTQLTQLPDEGLISFA